MTVQDVEFNNLTMSEAQPFGFVSERL